MLIDFADSRSGVDAGALCFDCELDDCNVVWLIFLSRTYQNFGLEKWLTIEMGWGSLLYILSFRQTPHMGV